MSDRTRRIATLALHEVRAAVRNRALVSLSLVMVCVSAVSVYIGAADYRSQLADYEAYKAAAVASGLTQVAPSPLALLSLMRGAMEYIEIIGAIIGITLGYLSVSRERSNRTLPLIRSRPVTSGEIAAGTALGSLAVISTMIVATAATSVVCLGLIGHDWVGPGQALKLLLAFVASIIYMGTFFCLGAVCAARSRVAVNGLVAALGIWLVVVLVLPQIGDTLDADNQVPGGLFSALTLNKPQEVEILTHFGTYEHIRTGIEEASFAKHYERFSFAMTDVADKYRGFSLGRLLGEKRNDIGWLVAYPTVMGWALVRSIRTQPTIPQGDTS